MKTEQWNKYESTWQISAVCRVIASTQYSQFISPVFLFFFFVFEDVCFLKPHRKCHYTHPCEFVNSLFETGRQEKAISNSETFSTMNMFSLMSLVPIKTSDTVNFDNKLLCCDETACCIWYMKSKTVLWVTHLSAAHSFCSFQLYGISTSIPTNIDLTFIMLSAT